MHMEWWEKSDEDHLESEFRFEESVDYNELTWDGCRMLTRGEDCFLFLYGEKINSSFNSTNIGQK